MGSNELSILSDELKPRRTPEPSSFKEMLPRPSVPDLSIVENAQPNSRSSQPVPDQRETYLKSLSYNEWRKRSGVGERLYPPQPPLVNPNQSDSTVPPSSHCNSVTNYSKKMVVLDCISNPSQKYGLSDSAPCLRKTPSYSDFKMRPTSAPVDRAPTTKNCQTSESSSSVLSASENPKLPKHVRDEKGVIYASVDPVSAGRSLQHLQPTFVGSAGSGVRNYSFLPKEPCPPENGIPIGSISSQPVPLNHLNYNREIPHHPFPICALPSVDSCHSECKPCCHKHVPLSCMHSLHNDQGLSRHASTSSCNLMSERQSNMESSSRNPSFDDLCRIVLAQNNELKTLQTQVEKLLLSQEQNRYIQCEPPHALNVLSSQGVLSPKSEKSHVTRVCDEGTQTSDSEERTDNGQKMSIGVMTSLIHAVAYSGRVELRDETCKTSCDNALKKNGPGSENVETETSSSSGYDDEAPTDSRQGNRIQQCKECTCKGMSTRKVFQKHARSKHTNTQKNSKDERKVSKPTRGVKQSNSICSQVGSYNNPGVSAAISAVRGCQAALASNTGMRLDESFTFNAVDLPTVPEQPVSPMSSIHVDLQDYRESTTDESGSSGSDCNSSNDLIGYPNVDEDSNRCAFSHKVHGQTNKLVNEKMGLDAIYSKNTPNPSKPFVPAFSSSNHKGLDVSSKRVAFQAQNGNEKTQNLKELALRYLKENHPEELAGNPAPVGGKLHTGENVQEMAVYNVPASNMSFATFRYLERYNLLPENCNPGQYLEAAVNVCGFNQKGMGNVLGPDGVNNGINRLLGDSRRHPKSLSSKSRAKPHQLLPPEAHKRSLRKGHYKASGHNYVLPLKSKQQQQQLISTPPSKILDITALRQQPKLL